MSPLFELGKDAVPGANIPVARQGGRPTIPMVAFVPPAPLTAIFAATQQTLDDVLAWEAEDLAADVP